MFKYVLSAHAEIVVKERSIRSEWLERILEKPEKTQKDNEDPKLTHALGRISEQGDRVLRVIYNPTIDPLIVVTAYFDRAMRNKL
ncbi:MAG: DUF4258 domain-containing protein [Burkholderiales bacterium]